MPTALPTQRFDPGSRRFISGSRATPRVVPPSYPPLRHSVGERSARRTFVLDVRTIHRLAFLRAVSGWVESAAMEWLIWGWIDRRCRHARWEEKERRGLV